eukprot:5312673-Pyramimonas_sp.AAC.1
MLHHDRCRFGCGVPTQSQLPHATQAPPGMWPSSTEAVMAMETPMTGGLPKPGRQHTPRDGR